MHTLKVVSHHPFSTGHEAGGGGTRKAHPGFAAIQNQIAHNTNPRTGKPYGAARAGAILGSRTRGASAAAHKANPRLNRVKG